MRPTSFLVALLSGPILFAQAAPSKEELKVREMLAKDKPYKAISTCDHMIGSQHRNEFLALRAQGLNMIAAYDRAETDARRALAAFPGDVPSLHQLAIAELGLGKTDSAAIHFQRVLRTDRSRDVRYRMALTYQKQHNYRDALMQLDQALVEGAKDGPDAAKYHRVKGECLSMRNDSVLARIEYDKALALSPRDQVTLNSRGG